MYYLGWASRGGDGNCTLYKDKNLSVDVDFKLIHIFYKIKQTNCKDNKNVSITIDTTNSLKYMYYVKTYALTHSS